MSWILRTWRCLNRRCGVEFEAGEPYPACPTCRGAKVQYIPGGGHVLHGATKHADRTLKEVASSYGLTNLRSARQGEAAHPGLAPAKVISGLPPLNAGHGITVPRTMTPSASFARVPGGLKGFLPVNGPRFKKHGGLIPTDVRYRTQKGDPR